MGLMFVSCTGRFKDLNTDNTGITDEDMQVDLNRLGISKGFILTMIMGRGRIGLIS